MSTAGLLGHIAHDLKNPLTTVIANAEYLVRAPELTVDSREALAELVESAAAVERLLGELGTLAAALAGHLTPRADEVRLAQLCGEVIAAAAVRAGRVGVRLRVDAAADDVGRLDALLVRQLLTGLIGLALRRAPTGTEVVVAARGRDGRTTLRILDEGSPLPQARVDALFGEDTGVTARVVHAIAQAHGGTVRAESCGLGLLVTVDLPALGT